MLRPVFGEGELITSINNEPLPEKIEKAVVYTNPSDGKFYIKGFFNYLKVYGCFFMLKNYNTEQYQIDPIQFMRKSYKKCWVDNLEKYLS
jgi:hypothetical protein